MKIVSIVGARPQFVKAAMVSRALRSLPHASEVLVHTGQHYDANMSEIFFRELEVPAPHHSLGVGSGTHGTQTGRMLEAIERVLLEEGPDWVVIYGDTNSTLAGALAAVKLKLPLAHVEAGLRLYDRHIPEEVNRLVADHVSDLNFAPTITAERNLRAEGIADGRVRLTGDVMYDAALYYGAKAKLRRDFLRELDLSPRGYILATVHRAENTDNPATLRAIFEGLCRVSRDTPVVLPLHPRTRHALIREGLLNDMLSALMIIGPASYLDMLQLEKGARAIATDSGGVQKEAFFHGVPCLTLAMNTPWTELLDLGWNTVLPGISAREVEEGIRAVIERPRGAPGTPYGDGSSAIKIASCLVSAQ
jgi:UDP-GlcNAc3NAcA epimerase